MELSALTAISPLDGRYHSKLIPLQAVFSEYGLMHQRFIVELRWLQALCNESQIKECPPLSDKANKLIEQWITQFSLKDAERIKDFEKTTNHDVKALEYFIKEKMQANKELAQRKEMIHFACTSEDINNLAYGLMLKRYRQDHLLPTLTTLIKHLSELVLAAANTPMLARTHGQAATPTTFGKEMANVVARLKRQKYQLEQLPLLGKCNGAVGNFNAHVVAIKEVDWQTLSRKFIESLGLEANLFTTQIEPHDTLAEWCHNLIRINTIVIDLCRDLWGYISLGYLVLNPVKNEVGSSVMPHKVNPIDFENAEGNLGIATSLLQHLAIALPVSRWQRDLSDSTRLRNLGSAFAYSQLGLDSCIRGLTKIKVDAETMAQDLEQHWEVLSEAIQTVMRRYGLEAPYEQLKNLTRGKKLDKTALHAFIQNTALPDEVKQTLLKLTPQNYIGLAAELALKSISMPD